MNSYAAVGATRKQAVTGKEDKMTNPLRKFVEFNRELDRGLAVMHSQRALLGPPEREQRGSGPRQRDRAASEGSRMADGLG